MMKINLPNEYYKGQIFLMAYPCNFDVADHNSPHKGSIDSFKTFEQYNNFVNLVIDQGVKVQFLDIINSTQQVFTRDIGFVVNDIFFVSKLKTPERLREIGPLIKFINRYNLKHHIMQNSIEGGDVVHHNNILFIGISDRTNLQAVEEVQKVLDDNNINITTIPIKFDTTKIHLDCTFNTLDQDTCIFTDYVYDINIIKEHVKNCIKMEKKEADELGVNYVYLGDKKVITSSEGAKNLLNNNGFEAYYTDYSEIIKDSGSLCCSILPILGSNLF